jgi:hypothetical protein
MRRYPSASPTEIKSIIRRIQRLEASISPAFESEQARRLREQMEDGRRRVAEAVARGELSPPETGPHVEARQLRLVQATQELMKYQRAREMKRRRR